LRYFVDLSIVHSLEDCVDLSIIDGLAGGLEDGGDCVLVYLREFVLGAFPERLARARAEAYCIVVKY
jgi:hypothetical protein